MTFQLSSSKVISVWLKVSLNKNRQTDHIWTLSLRECMEPDWFENALNSKHPKLIIVVLHTHMRIIIVKCPLACSCYNRTTPILWNVIHVLPHKIWYLHFIDDHHCSLISVHLSKKLFCFFTSHRSWTIGFLFCNMSIKAFWKNFLNL